MSSIASIAAASAVANKTETQINIAAKITKMNAESDQLVASLIESSAANLKEIVNSPVAPGVGGNVDTRA